MNKSNDQTKILASNKPSCEARPERCRQGRVRLERSVIGCHQVKGVKVGKIITSTYLTAVNRINNDSKSEVEANESGKKNLRRSEMKRREKRLSNDCID